MSEPAGAGWYEDPSGEPGLYAFWDGGRWAQRSRTPPAGEALPLQTPREGHSGRGRSIAWILLLAMVLFALGVLGWLLVR